MSPTFKDAHSSIIKQAIEGTRDQLKVGEVLYSADEFNVSWMPALKAMWSPQADKL